MSDINLKKLVKRMETLEDTTKKLEDRIIFLEKTLQEHAHNINTETVQAIAHFVKQDIVNTLAPPQSIQQEPVEEAAKAEAAS